MNVMNMCAKFHKDSLSGKEVNFNLPSTIKLSETADFVHNFVQKPYASEQLGGTFNQFSFECFYEIFTEDASLLLLHHGGKKSKMTKNSNQGGLRPCAFFSMFLVTFFFTKPTRARGKKTKCPKKKTHWFSVPDHLTDKSHTKFIVLRAVILFFFYFLPNDDGLKQFPFDTKV